MGCNCNRGPSVAMNGANAWQFPTVGHLRVDRAVTYRARDGRVGGGIIRGIALVAGIETVSVRDGVSSSMVELQPARGDQITPA